ncbi:unnamed protein product [Plasmodium vivax]|uniref:(malaria parasite P. vivax) hypothetical protein n=1 Tax=Plasmodium vivax TaxID=5855 RepID=A0A8S4HNK8_PLAVI|nr:unnamed protein product [Plasmodium vivax]
MAKKPPNPWYFKYQDYDAVKKSFVYEPRETIDVSFANYLINSIHNTRDNELKLRKTFCELKKLVRRHHSFMTYYPEKCCNYINYWLNKTVRESDYRVNKENFNIFEEFMQVDPKIGKNNFNCISRLSYMDTDSFQKMKKLYDLYDYFTELKESKDRTSLCKNISVLNEKYESVFQECKEKDNNLCNKLTNLKSEIVKDKFVANDICTKQAFDLFILKIDPPREEQKAVTAHAHVRKSGEKPPSTHVSGYSSQAHAEKSEGTHTPPHVTVSSSHAQGPTEQGGVERERTSSVPQQQLTAELPPLPLLQLGQLRQLEQLESSETEEPTGPKGLAELEPELRQEQEPHIDTLKDAYPFREVEKDTFPEDVYPSAGSMQPTFNTETIMERMKIAVSNVLEQVEPAPILGVSGGMGALFLLFKYTPVGSFFGRRRARMNLIPNNFGEYYTGFSPGFPEQDFGKF